MDASIEEQAMIIPEIQMQSGWATHVQSDQSNIAPGAPDPTKFCFVQGLPTAPTAMLCRMEGPKWAACEYYLKSAEPANTGRLTLDFDLTPGADFIANAWIKETDTIICASGKKFNMSMQRVMATNAIQISNQAGGWVNAGFTAPPFVAAQPLHHQVVMQFDQATGRYGIEVITIGGQQNLVALALDELVDIPTNWADGVYLQNQDQLGPNGGTLTYTIDNIAYTWG
jgi:hypothetical protein